VIAVVAAAALLRGGLFGLPRPPAGVNAESAGLAHLDRIRERAAALEAAGSGTTAAPATAGATDDQAFAVAAEGMRLIHAGDHATGFARLREAFESVPRDLVIGNAYRMAALHLKSRYMADPSLGATETERIPDWLAREPLATIERVHERSAEREVTLQYAMAWADEIVLFHALEIQAPANVESVRLLSELLEREPAYVPALYGRGLGYLHRPARLFWPEARKAPPNAASRDLGLAVAIGTKIGGATPRLRSRLTLALADAYGKEGQASRARSWWQVAQNIGKDSWLQEAVRRRFAFQDADLLDRLEVELEHRLADLEDPLTDLAIMWR
jgi:hypothetical protein